MGDREYVFRSGAIESRQRSLSMVSFMVGGTTRSCFELNAFVLSVVVVFYPFLKSCRAKESIASSEAEIDKQLCWVGVALFEKLFVKISHTV